MFQVCQQSPLFVFCFYFVSLLFHAPTRPARTDRIESDIGALTRLDRAKSRDKTKRIFLSEIEIREHNHDRDHELNALHFASPQSPSPVPLPVFLQSPAALLCFVMLCSVCSVLLCSVFGSRRVECGMRIATMPACALDWREQPTDSHHRVLVMFMGSSSRAHTE